MYVCICRAISDREIRDAVDRGAETLYAVQCELPVASCCGRCQEMASAIIEEHLQLLSKTQKAA